MKNINKVFEVFKKDEKLKLVLKQRGFIDSVSYSTYTMPNISELVPELTPESDIATIGKNLFLIRLYLSKVYNLETTKEDLKQIFELVAEVDDKRTMLYPTPPKKEKKRLLL